ncbi:hypothetical protein BH24GEM3_BH24GEM3_00760 [soil metagenome]|jgi:bifunctional DNase/RNase
MRRSRAASLAALLLCGSISACAVPTGEPVQPDPAFTTVEIAGLGVDPQSRSPIVLLREPGTERVVPIWIGISEAEAIARSLEGIETPRPMTHDLLASTVEGLGARVEEVVILEQREGIYYGVIRLATGARGRRVEIDSRPSDGLALALRTGAPIRVARALFMETPEQRPPARPTA